MDCRTSSEIMIKQMDGPLAEAESKALQQHVAVCPVCQQEAGQWQQLSIMLDRLPDLNPSPGFEYRVMAAIDPMYGTAHQSRPEANRGMLLVWIGIMGAASLLVVEAVARVQQWVISWFMGTALYQLAVLAYESVVARGLFYVLVPRKGLWEWISRFEATDSWWTSLGTFNLVMVLVLIKILLDSLLASGRGEVR